MKSKTFEYTSKDKPFLKKDLKMRLFFFILFLCVFIWQIVSMVVCGINGTLTTFKILAGIFSCIIIMLFSLICLLYISKSTNAIKRIKSEGKAISSVFLLVATDKKGFMYLYNIVANILAIVAGFVAVCGITYFILQLSVLSTYSFYMPLLFFITICGFNSVYHIKYELANLRDVEKYNSAY